jgi:FkbM family methyltransferase
MTLVDHLVRAWQSAPFSWRKGFVGSPVAPLVRGLMNRAYGHEPRVFELAPPLKGYCMRLHWEKHKAFVFGTHEPEVVRAIRDTVCLGSTTLDIGSHLGYYTLLLAKLVGPQGKVISFEAAPEIFDVLKQNVELNACTNVVLENRAVADSMGRLLLRRNDDDPLSSTSSLKRGRPEKEIEATRLDDYLEQRPNKISFVKMDVEGAEADALEGMAGCLRRDRPTLLIELHGFDGLGERHPALIKLREFDYRVRYLEPPGAQIHVLASVPSENPAQAREF